MLAALFIASDCDESCDWLRLVCYKRDHFWTFQSDVSQGWTVQSGVWLASKLKLWGQWLQPLLAFRHIYHPMGKRMTSHNSYWHIICCSGNFGYIFHIIKRCESIDGTLKCPDSSVVLRSFVLFFFDISYQSVLSNSNFEWLSFVWEKAGSAFPFWMTRLIAAELVLYQP